MSLKCVNKKIEILLIMRQEKEEICQCKIDCLNKEVHNKSDHQ